MSLKIRERYQLQDRIRLFLVVFLLLLVVIGLFCLIKSEEQEEQKVASISRLLRIAQEPVGTTMYIWGGGWDDEDSASGASSTHIGVSPQWEYFTSRQDETYDFKKHRFERENGLDCSGYVGWVIYNTFETENGQPGYVTTSTEMAEVLANRGWGKLIKNPKEFLPGDIVSMEGHVWICMGTCADGSVLLVHSSPPGVSVCGTVAPQNCNEKSIAEQLAEEYMTTHYPDWQKRYPHRTVSSSYLEKVSVFRWNEDTMIDATKMQNMSGEEIIVYISPDV